MLPRHEIESICNASHGDPFSVLGPHTSSKHRIRVACFLPSAVQVMVTHQNGTPPTALTQRHSAGFFEGTVPMALGDAYQLDVQWASGLSSTLDDPYRFPVVLGEMDVWLLGEGTHLRPFEVLGAHPVTMLGVEGTR